jgi:hypothetical protein
MLVANPTGKNGKPPSENRFILLDLHGDIVGTTYTTDPGGLYHAIHPTTGEEWGLVECAPVSRLPRRIFISDLEPLIIKRKPGR